MYSLKLTIVIFLSLITISLFGQWAPRPFGINPFVITTTGEAGNDIPTIQHNSIPFLRFELDDTTINTNDGAGLNFRRRQLAGNFSSDALLWFNYGSSQLYFATNYLNPESTTVFSFDADRQEVTEAARGFANFGRLNNAHLSFDECTVQARRAVTLEQTLRLNPWGGGVVINGRDDKTAADGELKLFGDLCLTGMIKYPSDRRLKQNVIQIDNALEKIKALSPVSYEYKTDKFPDMHLPTETRRGFIAQEVEELFPEMVFEDGTSHEYKSMNYQEIIPVAVKAIQEQQLIIDHQASELLELKSLVQELIDSTEK